MSAKGRGLSAEDTAECFRNALEDETSSLKRKKGESCSPAELCRVQKGEKRVENLKKKYHRKQLVVCVKYELQIVSESTRHRNKQHERNETEHTGQSPMELGKENEAAQKAEESAMRKTPCNRSPR